MDQQPFRAAPDGAVRIKSVGISPQEIIVASQNIWCDYRRGGRTARNKSKCYLIPGTSSNQHLALLTESSLHFNSEARAAAAKGEEGQRAREERSGLPSIRDSCLATLNESFGLKSLEILRSHLPLFL